MRATQIIQAARPLSRIENLKGAGPALCLSILLALLAPSALAWQGNGHGNGNGNGGGGGGGGGGDDGTGGGGSGAPADPAIAFVGPGWLGVMNADGSNLTQLLSNGHHPDWSPDLDGDPSNGYQGALAFELYLPDGTTDVHLADIRVVDGVPTALRVRRLPVPQSFEASWSPDVDPALPGYQGRIAFADDLGIEAVDVWWDGNLGDPSTIASSDVLNLATWDDTDVAFLYDSIWSRDGTRLLYSVLHYDFSTSMRVIDDLDLPEPRVVLDDPALSPTQPDWSHGSSEIVFASGGVLYTLDVDLPGSLTSTGVTGQEPSYSPDDTRWVFDGPGWHGDRSIYVHDRATGQSTLLLAQKHVNFQRPDWRPE